jgi:hypothetical protein
MIFPPPAGLVLPGRICLDPPASVAIYELTSRGRTLEPVLIELGRWGTEQPVTTSGELSVNALLLALKTVFNPAATILDPAPATDPGPATPPDPGDPDATYALRIDGEWFHLDMTGDTFDVTPGRCRSPVVTLDTDVATLRSVAFGRESLISAERDGRLTITGDRRAAERFTHMFPVPGRRAPSPGQRPAEQRPEAEAGTTRYEASPTQASAVTKRRRGRP